MASEHQAHPSLELLDVLEKLPRDVLRDNLWLHLREEEAPVYGGSETPTRSIGRPFRLACHRTRQLADQLTRRLQLMSSTADLQLQGAFLSRQEGLTQLTLGAAWQPTPQPESAAELESLVVSTLQLGDAGCRHLQRLQINLRASPGHGTGQAVQLHCPDIAELCVKVPLQLAGAFFQPLRSCPHLLKVCIVDWSESMPGTVACDDAVAALAGLPHLRTLLLRGWLTADGAGRLASLTHLRELLLDYTEVRVVPDKALQLGRLLGTMTQLTALELPEWSDTPHSRQVGIDVTSQLGRLQQLTALSVGFTRHSVLTLDGPLSQLSALQRLTWSGDTPPLSARTGVFPLLQHLRLEGNETCESLAATLQPLMPFAQLRSFKCALQCSAAGSYENAANDTDGTVSERLCTSVGRAAKMLAAAPHLHTLHLDLHGCRRPAATGPTVAVLMPLRDKVTCLGLSEYPRGALHSLWPLLCDASRLVTLELACCHVPEYGLLQLVGQRLPTLRGLCVVGCVGISGDTAVALAGVRQHALCVDWDPLLSGEQARLFCAAAQMGVTLGFVQGCLLYL